MSKFLYAIMRLPETNEEGIDKNVNDRKLPSFIKWWLYNRSKQVLSDVITGSNLTLPNSAKNRKFKKFIVNGATEQAQYEGKNLANIYNINNTNTITIENDEITLKDNTNPVGYTPTSITLKQLCPNLVVGDKAILSYKTTSNSSSKNTIYLNGANTVWTNNTLYTVTQEMLDSIVALYGGHDEIAIISEFMIRLNNTTENYEPYVRRNTKPLTRISTAN